MGDPFFVFSAMGSDDIDEVLQLDRQNLSAWSISAFKGQLHSPHGLHLVVRHCESGELLAFVCGQLIVNELEIHKLCVAHKWRRQGIARSLLHRLFRDHPSCSVFLELRAANKPARNLYETLGFSCCGLRKKYYSSPTDDAIIMKL